MKSNDLRHRVTIQRKAEVVDPVSGYRDWSWSDYATDVPAKWLAGPGREFLASEALRSEVQGRFELRWSPLMATVTPLDRALWDGRVYDIKSPPLTDLTARRTITLMVAEGLNDG